MTGWLGKETDWYPQMRSSYPLIIKSSSAEVTLRVHSHGTQIPLYIFAYSVSLSTYLFSKFPCHQFSNHVPSKSLTIQSNHCHGHELIYIVAHLAISPSKQSEQPGTLLKVLPTGKTSLHHCPGMSQRGAVHFGVVPVYHTETSVSQAYVFSFFINWL